MLGKFDVKKFDQVLVTKQFKELFPGFIPGQESVLPTSRFAGACIHTLANLP